MLFSALWEAMEESKTVQKKEKENTPPPDSDFCSQVWAGFETESQ